MQILFDVMAAVSFAALCAGICVAVSYARHS